MRISEQHSRWILLGIMWVMLGLFVWSNRQWEKEARSWSTHSWGLVTEYSRCVGELNGIRATLTTVGEALIPIPTDSDGDD